MIINVRWKMYLDFLETHGDDYAQVLVADTRDVICQSDVFEAFSGQSNYLGYTTEDGAILPKGKPPNDYIWVKSRFGKEEANKLADKLAICCGTVIGTVDEIKIFCLRMWDFLKADTVWGHEQAAMNYFVYNNLLPIENLIKLDVENGAMIAMALNDKIPIQEDFILRGDGGVPAVVHQYDRHAPLVQLVDRVYRDKNFQADERFADPRSNLEQVKQLIFFGKLNDAARFFMKKFLDGANFDGNINLLLKLWEMLLNRPLTPAVGYLELSVQSALASAKNYPIQQLNAVCLLLTHTIKNRRTVDPRFVNFIAGGLMNIAEQGLNARNADLCFFCVDAIKTFDLPPSKDFYLLQAKAYRTFGRKDEALTAYKAALEFG